MSRIPAKLRIQHDVPAYSKSQAFSSERNSQSMAEASETPRSYRTLCCCISLYFGPGLIVSHYPLKAAEETLLTAYPPPVCGHA